MPLRSLLQSTDFFAEPLALLMPDGTIDISNQPFADALGFDIQGLVGKRLDALAMVSASAIQEFVRACAKRTHVVEQSLLFQRNSESIRFQARGVAYLDGASPSASQVLLQLVRQHEEAPHGSSERQFSHWRDVEDSLRRQSQILEVTLASIGDAVIVTDARGRVTFMNSVAETLTGWSAQSARGSLLKDVFHIVNEQTRARVDDPVTKVLQTGACAGLANHTVLLTRNGGEIPIDDSAAPIRLADSTLFGVVLIFRDITEQRRAEITRGWLASIIESSDDAIVSKTLDGRITSWNPGAIRLFGYTPEEIIGKSISTIIPPELYAEEDTVLARLRRGERVEHFETTRIARDGRRIDVSLTVSPVRNEAGTIVGASKIARDISDRKRSERLLREADRRKDEFLAVLAHELRNPLAPMRYASALLHRSASDQGGARIACEIIDRQLGLMTHLVDDLLDVSRITSGRIDLKFEPIGMMALLQIVQSSLHAAFESARQTTTLNGPSEEIYVCADRIRLVQVFFNILQNANKYTPNGGQIEITLSSEEGFAVVHVRDSGVGIPAGMQERVFELFAQIDSSTDRARGGLGIGLTLARRLVELHGGSIGLRSAGEDQGSDFIIRLPQHDLAADHPRTRASSAAATRKLRVLVVDNNDDAALSLRLLLESMGHDARVATDRDGALTAADDFRPEVAILNVDSTGPDGYHVARTISVKPWATATRLIALGARAPEPEAPAGREARIDHHLIKPVLPETLEAILAQVARAELSTSSAADPPESES